MKEGETIYTPDREGKSNEKFSLKTVLSKKVIAVQGVQGVQGNAGIQGPSDGVSGSQGIQGSMGIQGYIGIQGSHGTGSQGIQGIQGVNAGQGAIGSQGASGTNGSQGATGLQGNTGTQGISGTAVSQGATGAQGTAGTNGTNGTQGAQGLQGTTGAGSGLTMLNGADNRVVTASGASSLNGEANLTFSGSQLSITGTVLASSSMTATNFNLSSDKRLKTDIEEMPYEEMDIKFKQYVLKSEPSRIRYGVIAQDLLKTNPELVSENSNGMLSVSMIDLLVKYCYYLKCEIDRLKMHK